MDEVDEDGSELPPKRVPAHMHMLLGQAPQTLCLHFPRRHQRYETFWDISDCWRLSDGFHTMIIFSLSTHAASSPTRSGRSVQSRHCVLKLHREGR